MSVTCVCSTIMGLFCKDCFITCLVLPYIFSLYNCSIFIGHPIFFDSPFFLKLFSYPLNVILPTFCLFSLVVFCGGLSHSQHVPRLRPGLPLGPTTLEPSRLSSGLWFHLPQASGFACLVDRPTYGSWLTLKLNVPEAGRIPPGAPLHIAPLPCQAAS